MPDHSLKLWDVATGKAVAAYNPELRGAAWSVVFAPDGKALLVGDLGLSVRVLSLPEVRERAAWPTSPERGYVAKHLAIAPDGKTVAAGLTDGTLLIYAADSGQVVRKLSQDSAITALAVSPDGKTLAAGTDFGLQHPEVRAAGAGFYSRQQGAGDRGQLWHGAVSQHRRWQTAA